jgi:hypothetical protein|tara:strand:+ start:936 stop:1754 length:819 start_codon:yes stop_codon:yes gene_type:complete
MKILKLGQMIGGANSPKPSGFDNEYSINFDGVDDYLTFGDATAFTPNGSGAGRGFSIGMWFKTTDASAGFTNKFLITKTRAAASQQEYEMQIQSTGKISLKFIGGGGGSLFDPTTRLETSTALNTGAWKHIVFTWSLASPVTTSNFKVYVNGSQDTSATLLNSGTMTAVKNGSTPLTAMAFEPTGGLFARYTSGNTDEIFIVDDELSASQVTDIYNGGTPIDMTTINHLVGWWRNGDPTGTGAFPTITDQSSNSNDGTMTNMTSSDIVTDVP